MGRFPERSIARTPRARDFFGTRGRSFILGFRIVLFLLVLALLRARYLYSLYRKELSDKYSPTIFTTPDSRLWQTHMADLGLRQEVLQHHDQWKALGSGWEGKTFMWNGSVIKTFTPARSPFRNCVLGHPITRWPTEIPASLVFGGTWQPDDGPPGMSGFLPVKAFFMADPSGQARPEWHLITPFLSGGNLNDLAKRLRGHHPYKHFHEVDSAYRPAFNNLLRVLESLHSRGFCHDDIKPSNIFLQSDTNWILGDLGNVRQIDHLYHSSRLWVQDNSQLADCRANDSLRALKSYLQFIRAASDDFEAFEGEIFAGRETLSRLFWWAIADASSMGAAELRIRSEIEDPRQTSSQRSTVGVHTKPYYSFLLGKRKSLSIAVDQALRTSFSERAARWAAMSWLFGIPVERCA